MENTPISVKVLDSGNLKISIIIKERIEWVDLQHCILQKIENKKVVACEIDINFEKANVEDIRIKEILELVANNGHETESLTLYI